MTIQERIVCQMFCVSDMNMISKPALVNSLVRLRAEFDQMHVDLFCENPKHSRFANFPPQNIAMLQAESDRRKAASEQSEKVKELKEKRTEALSQKVEFVNEIQPDGTMKEVTA